MDAATKELRPYQVRLITDVARATGDVLVEQPTGSGKTMQIVALVAMQLGRRFTHAIISAPQEQIEHGFVHRDYERIDWPQTAGVAVPAVEVPEEIIWGARQSQLGSVKRLLAYLRQAAPVDHALACTHAALNLLTADNLPDDLNGKALFLDEAHHAPADGLSRFVSVWRERGGQLFFFTATPYRADGLPVALDGMRLFRRSLAEHMDDGFAPRHLDSEIVALGKPGDAITPGQFTGEDAPPPSYFDGLIQAICRKWLDDGKPKAIVRVPPMRGGSEGLVSRLIHVLSGCGARVLNATGTGTKDKQRFLAALESEKNRTWIDSSYDIIVGIQRVMEGTDWPVCSAVYCVGMPGSLNTVVQLLGRAMRPKRDDCPSPHRDRARLVFFVPCGGGTALENLSLDHSRHALLTCCFLADHEVGQEWIVLREVRRGIEAALGSRTENPAAADAENEADEALDPEVRAAVELAMASAREQIVSTGGEPTVAAVVELAAKTRPDLPAAALQRVATEILAGQSDGTGAAVREAIQQEVAKRVRIDPRVKEAMAAAFAIVLDEFRNLTLQESAVLESVRRQVHGVTGGQIREFAQRLRDAVPRPLTEEQILAWADMHHQQTGEWPRVSSGPLVSAPEENWANLNQLMTHGLRGLRSGSSLAQLLHEHRGVKNANDPPSLTEGQILAWADEHFQRTGKWPGQSSGIVHDAPDETWANINAALRIGLRNLPIGSSLAKLFSEKRGARHPLGLTPLTEEQILAWADQYHDSKGEWPTRDSGPINGTAGDTWDLIDQALTSGRRTLTPGSSLPKLLAEHRGVRNIQDLPPLSIDQVLSWADEHFEQTGKWPTTNSGPIREAPGETWMGIHRTLQKGRRGLAANSSLAKFLRDHRGKRYSLELVRLTAEQILAWADSHHQRTGHWPKRTSGSVPEAPGETWSGIDGALNLGNRGLDGESSLARLLAERRRVRNRKALSPLTIEIIFEWADMHYRRTGTWPTQKSGPIDDAPGETWCAIDASLKTGRRSLRGGSSLAKLLEEWRANSTGRVGCA